MPKNILKVNGLTGKIGDFTLSDINFSIERGSVMGLIGKNGAGKTTLINMISGLLPRCGGEVLFDGKKMSGNEVEIKNMLGLVLDPSPYPQNLSPILIAKMVSKFYEKFDYNKFESLMQKFNLPCKKSLIKLSTGQKNTFNIIVTLCHEPDLIIMDEPTAGLDPQVRSEIIDLLHEFVEDENRSILFSTHITSDLEKIADKITFIDSGKCIFTKDIIELTEKMALCRIDKTQLTEELKKYIFGYKETLFGLECLVHDKSQFENIPNVQFATPSIEDVIIYTMKGSDQSANN